LTSASAPSLFANKRDSAETFISKLDSNGNYVWAKQFFGIHIDRTLTTPDGNGFDGANNIAVDSEDNIYATGIFGSTVDFDPGEGLKTLTSEGAANWTAMAIISGQKALAMLMMTLLMVSA
jgi:hypothetical protein